MKGREATGGGAWLLLLAVGLAAALTVAGAMALTRWLDVPPGQNRLLAFVHVKSDIDRLASPERDARRPRIAYLGDSTVMSFSTPQTRLPARLQARLRTRPISGRRTPGIPADVYDLAFPALGTFSWYYLADLVAAAEPDLVVWEVSFTHLSPNWRKNLVRNDLSGWMDDGRAGEILTLPVEYTGLTVDRFLLYQAIVRLGGLPTWLRVIDEQSRIGGLKANREKWLSRYTGVEPELKYVQAAGFAMRRKRNRPDRPDRYGRDAELIHYGDALTGLDREHPVLQVLGAGLRVYRRAGIPVIVYLNPINVDNLKAVGAWDGDIIRQSVAVYREVSEANGASFVDLHDLFSDAYFEDVAGHFTELPDEDAGGLLVEKLAPHAAALLRTPRNAERRP